MPNNLPVSDLEKLLEKVAHKAYSEALTAEEEFAENVYVRVMARELLPLLEAGEAMRVDHIFLAREENRDAWDAAKLAALKGE